MDRETFETTYVNPSGTFADNTTRDITESDMRQFASDIADSIVFVTGATTVLTPSVFNIGSWNLEAESQKTVWLSGLDTSTIRMSGVELIRDDSAFQAPLLGGLLGSGQSGTFNFQSGSAVLIRGGFATGFLSPNWDASGAFNRGYITVFCS